MFARSIYSPAGAEGSQFDIITGAGRERARLPLVGEHNILNALAADPLHWHAA